MGVGGGSVTLRIGVLGPVEVWRSDGVAVAAGGTSVRALLALLALHAGRFVGVDALVDGLWGAQPPAGAANALQSQVSRLRRVLAAVEAGVEHRPGAYRLAVEPVAVDVGRFEELVKAASGRADARAEEAAADLDEALALWRGAALADVREAPFAAQEAARLEDARLSAREERAALALRLRRPAEAEAMAREVVAAQPLRERARALTMRALHTAGRSAEALAYYAETQRVLAEELGADPGPELTALHMAMLRGEPVTPEKPDTVAATSRDAVADTPSDAGRRSKPDATSVSDAPSTPASSAISDRPSALRPPSSMRRTPAQLTSFVGRGPELERVRTLLRDGRLVSVVGPGGAGKTRLAVEAAERHPGDVCLVELAALSDDGQVVPAVATAVGIRDTVRSAGAQPPGRAQDLVERLAVVLAEEPPLLVLDNCEHVVAGVADLAHELLRRCPELRVLTTSREALGVPGEALCPLAGLEVAGAGGAGASSGGPALGARGIGPDAVAEGAPSPAALLFADRAAAVRPGFRLGVDNLAAVERVCGALDGLPLAIELAAARLRTLSLDEVGQRLDDRMRLLSRGSRTAPARHQTLRAVVGWSWELLDDEERLVARRLTVFRGGADVAAVAALCGVAEGTAEDVLTGLVEKSLVERVGGRYRMLATVQAYCVERLAEAGEEEAVRAAHAERMLTLAATAEPYLRGAEQVGWLARLDAEYANLLGALEWTAVNDVRAALRLLAALASYLYLRGRRMEATPVAVAVVAAVGEGPPEELDEEYLLALLLAMPADTDGSLRRRLDEHLGPRRFTPIVRWPFAYVYMALTVGPPPLQEGDPLPEMGADPWSRALGQFGWAYISVFAGRPDEGAALMRSALAGFTELGDRWGMGNALDGLATVEAAAGRRGEALSLISRAIDLLREVGAADDVADLLTRRGDELLRSGAVAEARADFEHVLDLSRQLRAPHIIAGAYHGLAEVAVAEGHREQARGLYEEALERGRTTWLTAAETQVLALLALAGLARDDGDVVGAEARIRQAMGMIVAIYGFHLPLAAAIAATTAENAVARSDRSAAAYLSGLADALAPADARPHRQTALPLAGLPPTGADTDDVEAAYRRGRAHSGRAALTALQQVLVPDVETA